MSRSGLFPADDPDVRAARDEALAEERDRRLGKRSTAANSKPTAGTSAPRLTLSQAEHRARQEQGLEPPPSLEDPQVAATLEKARGSSSRKAAVRKVAPKRAPRETTHAAETATGSVDAEPSASASEPWMTLAQALTWPKSATAGAILEAAGMMAFKRSGETALTFGLVTLFKACIAVGLGQTRNDNSSPVWLCQWISQRRVTPAALRTFAEQRRRKSLGDLTQIRLSPNAASVLTRASALAALTNPAPLLGARHLLLAILDHSERSSADALRAEFSKAFQRDLDEFRSVLIDQTIANAEPDETVALWRELQAAPLGEVLARAGKVAPLRAPAGTVVNFHADRVTAAGSDPLGIQADVSAFARLICLEEAKPPLSIGLFGEWGSGKSSFMERLQIEIAELTRKEREAREKARKAAAAAPADAAQAAAAGATAQPAAPRFVENVVQIRFNAWHYADANLWASLTAEFFDQLRRGGHEGQRSSDYLALIGKVADRVRSLEASSQQAQIALSDAEHAARDANEALAGARKKLATSDLALASEQLAETFAKIRNDKDSAEKLKEVGRRVYRDDLGKDADAFAAAVAEAGTIPGKAALVARVVAGGGWPTRLALVAIALVAIAGIGLRLGDPGELAVLVQRTIAWGGGVAAAAASIWQAMKLAKPVLDGAWAYAKAVETARKTLAKEVEAKESEAGKAALALAKARETADKARAPLAKYGDGAAAGAPGTILRYFLFEDSDVRDYDKQVGLVSRARRSFEQLDAIFGAKRDGLAAKEKLANLKPDETLDAKEIEALKRYEAMQLDKQGLVIPDRIVLYIDDLDRCTHQQVYDVLQAIHLLLAFELFVVVVGVDVRWVEEAVARQFTPTAEDLPDDAVGREAARHRAETERRKRAIDYLEKIFQLPFWLRRLSTEGDKGGSYGAYVKELLQANLDVSEDAKSPLAPAQGAPARKAFVPDRQADAGDQAGETAMEGLADATPAAEELASIELALATVRLTQAEVDFLASPEIGAIAFKSPRSVKRMLNVYRIVRARMSEAELDEFLGRNGKPATWPLAVFFAAVETSQPVEIADALYRAVRTIPPYERFDTVDASAILSSKEKTIDAAEGYDAIMIADEATGHAISLAVKAIERIAGEDDETDRRPVISDMLAMARIVRRYSFNRYH